MFGSRFIGPQESNMASSYYTGSQIRQMLR